MLQLSPFMILDATVRQILLTISIIVNEFYEFVNHEHMSQLAERVFWVHIEVPGQGANMPDLPHE